MKRIIFALATLLVLFLLSFKYQHDRNAELKKLLEKKVEELEYSNKLIKEREKNYNEQKEIVESADNIALNEDFIEQLCLYRKIPDSFLH